MYMQAKDEKRSSLKAQNSSLSRGFSHSSKESIAGDGSQDSQNSEPERVYRLVLAGDSAVGKTSFVMRLCKGRFETNVRTTLGVDFQSKTIFIDEYKVRLEIWDTAGQERYSSAFPKCTCRCTRNVLVGARYICNCLSMIVKNIAHIINK